MKFLTVSIFLALLSNLAAAEPCLQTDKKGGAGSSGYYDYGKCKSGPGPGTSATVSALGQQFLGMLPVPSNPNDRGYSDADREANRRALNQFDEDQRVMRSQVKMGAWLEFYGRPLKQFVFSADNLSDADRSAVRAEISAAIDSGTLIETFGGISYDVPGASTTWNSPDALTRWKSCEVATQLVRAYYFGDFVKPEQKDPKKGARIADAGYTARCGGTAYWLGRIYEDSDKYATGVSKKEYGDWDKAAFESFYDVAIVNGYTPAYERAAELHRLGGPPRLRAGDWRKALNDSADMFMRQFQYERCLESDPENLVCARGLLVSYRDPTVGRFGKYSSLNLPKAAALEAYIARIAGTIPTQVSPN